MYEWYTSGPRQRLQPGGAIIIVMTRWSKRDLSGQILKNSEKDGVNEWEVIDFPAILPSGTPLWPGFWKKEELEALKAELPVSKWEAQYQQNPTSEEGAIIKRDQWMIWKEEHAPDCEYIIQNMHPKNREDKKPVQMKIITTSANFYTFEYSFVGDSKKQRGTVTRLKQ